MKQSILTYNKTITSWDEGLPLGNGDIGCLIWGASNGLRFSLDKGDIWDTSGQPSDNEQFTYAKLIEWKNNKKTKKIYDTFDNCYNRPQPTKLPVGAIVVDLKKNENVISKLDMSIAEVELNIGKTTIKSFVHSGKRVGMIDIGTEICDVKLDIPQFGTEKRKWWQKISSAGITQSLKNLHYEKYSYVEKKIDGVEIKYFVQKVDDTLSYGVVLAIRKAGGLTKVAYSVMSTIDGAGYIESAIKTVLDAINNGYDDLIKSHKTWWDKYWQKSSIDIPDEVLTFGSNVGNYLLGSASRKGFYPMPLQGLWTADNGQLPPWKGDYHHDLNTQLTYFSYTKANHIEEGECFVDYLFSLGDTGKRFAKNFYGVGGLCLPSVMDIMGGALGGWAMYSLSPTNMLWLCDIISKHYEYTLDAEMLKQKIFPYFVEVEKFFSELFIEKNGKYYLPLSSSPEIHNNSLKAFVCPNSNYDLALIKKFYIQFIKYAEILNVQTDKYRNTLSKLDELAVDSDNVLMISPNERLTESHRHHSHAMSIFPLRLLDYDNIRDKKIIDATINDMEKLGTMNWVGYSFAWVSEFYAVQRQGEKARDTLNKFFKYFCLPNGFHINGDYTKQGFTNSNYRPFTLEGNFCAVDALQEMLLFSHNGIIEPLRAIPADWKNVSFTNLRAEGGILVSLVYENGELKKLSLAPTKDLKISVINKFSKQFTCNEEYTLKDNTIQINLKANTLVEFVLAK